MKLSDKLKRALSAALAMVLILCCALAFGSCMLMESDKVGDCNGDGLVNAQDSNCLGRHITGESISISKEGADLNSDGLLNDADRALIREYLAEVYLPGKRFEKIYLNGTDIANFTIVIPEKADDFEKWTAEILRDELEELTTAEIDIKRENEGKYTFEIHVGDTVGSDGLSASVNEGEYIICTVGSKILLSGRDYLVGAGAGYIISALNRSSADWNGEEYLEIPTDPVSRKVEWEQADNVFYFIGDGMGLNHTRMTTDENAVVEYADGTVLPPDESGCEVFWPSTFENVGEAVTLNLQESTTDSAAAATTLATGYKTLNGALGMIPADLDGDGEESEFRSVQNVREMATMRGMATAVISTDKITGATPNAFLVHHTTRKDRSVILEQQAALEKSRLACNYLWCSYDSDDVFDELSKALDSCDDNPGGFFIMTEEAMIDKYGEKMDYDNVIRTVKRLNEMTAYAATYAMCHRNTAIVITADHETGGLICGEDGVWRWTSDGEHTSLNVPVFAMGSGTEVFKGAVCDNTDIAKFVIDIVEH
ncbi:MAG: alkaline phosphatase [Clostridia bacterium]|nr:alkaline phosphatase [Clostridia bacterium]